MTDPLSITAGTIGITSAAISGISKLRQAVTDWRNAPQEVKDIKTSLSNTHGTLEALAGLRISDEALCASVKKSLEQTAISKTVNDCGDACERFTKDLAKWTARSDEMQMSTGDRLSVGIWHRAKVERLKTQVESCQSSVVFAVTSAQLLVQIQMGETSGTAHQNLQKQMQDLEIQISERMQMTKQQRSESEDKVRDLEDGNSDGDEDEMERVAAAAKCKKQSRLLEDVQASYGVMFSQVRSARTGQTIREIVTDKNSRAFVGMPESVVGKVEQLIEGVRTTDGSVAYVGVFTDSVDLGSPTA